MTEQPQVDLSRFCNDSFDRGACAFKEALWILTRKVFFEALPGRWYRLRRSLLRLFGATVGRGVVIKPGVVITHPWRLTIGDHTWIGEDCYLLTLAQVTLEPNVVISQQSMLCTGNHDCTVTTFDLRVAPITVESGAWLTARCIVGPGVTVGSHALLTMGSVTTKNLAPYGIFRGNPAKRAGTRTVTEMGNP